MALLSATQPYSASQTCLSESSCGCMHEKLRNIHNLDMYSPDAIRYMCHASFGLPIEAPLDLAAVLLSVVCMLDHKELLHSQQVHQIQPSATYRQWHTYLQGTEVNAVNNVPCALLVAAHAMNLMANFCRFACHHCIHHLGYSGTSIYLCTVTCK